MRTTKRPGLPATRGRHGNGGTAVTYRVTVEDGFAGVVRIAHLLDTPRCRVTALDVRRIGASNTWIVDYDICGTDHEQQNLSKRVERLPGVSKIELLPTHC
ncbi:hypothetical protein OH799_09185 [Nocardia sp. NBC_00881]|uniref:hypothetical protein n=1 Tax=Nocardia sp. NBC_00881 TaxID=2975995 RepID=UPI0038686B0A|nr:hypothetical protein OH799_09185 [Nocardia sp. NBC_00881]